MWHFIAFFCLRTIEIDRVSRQKKTDALIICLNQFLAFSLMHSYSIMQDYVPEYQRLRAAEGK